MEPQAFPQDHLLDLTMATDPFTGFARLSPVSEASVGNPYHPDCPHCTEREMHRGCPLLVFGFDRGRYMCSTYLDSFVG
ncbi:MAG: hypothetical protein ACE5MB_04060 [Anaerolineae bacterium]